ncbi:ABC transporter ATP-binding protein [Oxalobacter paraformigenes]|nr:ABC transporter transmembrane domain-containing protein [Oxalobacter paraformigenes]
MHNISLIVNPMFEKIRNSQFILNYRRMWPYVKPYWFRALLAMSLCIPIGSLDAVIALSLKPYMDMVLIEKSTGSSAWYAPLFIIGFTICQGGLTYLATYLNVWVGSHITNDLKMSLYNKLLTFETSFFDRQNSGDVVFRFNNDADLACAGLLSNLRLFLSRLFSSLSLIGVLFYNSWQLSVIAMVVLGCTFYPMTRVRNMIKALMKQTVASGSQTITAYNETFAGNRTIMAYNYQPQQKEKFRKILASLFKLSIKMTQRSSWLSPVMHITASFGIAATIGYGSHLILTNQLSPGGFVSFISALLMLYTPIKNLGNNFNSVQFSFMAIERVFELLDSIPVIRDKENATELKTVHKNIEFRNVNFSYNPGVPVLKNINLDAKVGQSIALVGNSGGGKSTIVSLLPRFYDVDSGHILIDGIDIREVTLASLRDKMAVVFQDNFLFSGTIRDNVKIGKPDASDDEIWKALDMAYLADFTSSLKEGLDTYIGERGILLSGGQKQRLAIARAFIKDAPIIILDEATSALDNKSEAVVQKAIENLMKDKTVFVIAHRLSTIRNADKIVVINEGEIMEIGSHEELMGIEDGFYKTLYNAQFKKSTK